MDICKSNLISLAFSYRCGWTRFFPTGFDGLAYAATKKIYSLLNPALTSSSHFSFPVRMGLQFSLALTVVQEDTSDTTLNKPVQDISRMKNKAWLQNPEAGYILS